LVAAFIVPRAAFPSNSLEARSSLFDREVGQSGLSNDKVDVDDDDDDDDDDCTSTTAPPTATVISSHNRTATSPQNPGPTNPATHAGGIATWYWQHETAGACGIVHQDQDLICALDSAIYNDKECGRQIKISADNGKTVIVTVADECPTCENPNSIDLSRGAFEKIGSFTEGTYSITWVYLD